MFGIVKKLPPEKKAKGSFPVTVIFKRIGINEFEVEARYSTSPVFTERLGRFSLMPADVLEIYGASGEVDFKYQVEWENKGL